MTLTELENWSPTGLYDVSDVLVSHIYERSRRKFAEGDATRDALTTPDDVKNRQAYIRERFLEGIGGLPPSDSPLNAHVTGVVAGDGFRVENVIFEARPKRFVTANLYIPDNVSIPSAAVLFLCGHHREAKHHPEYQSVCQTICRAGLIVLAQDPVGQGERLGYWEASEKRLTVGWGTTEHDHAGAQCWPLGDGLARYFLHDALRGLDYLASRPEVDASRIGITGNSGGGTQTSLVLLAAADRIAAAAPATFIMNRDSYQRTGGAQDAEQIWPNFTGAGLDHEDILLALCPKPVRVLAVTSDFFPIEGTRRTVERCNRLWEMHSAADAFGLTEDFSDHQYTQTLAKTAGRFFARHLLNRDFDYGDYEPTPFPPETLWCTKSGQVRGEFDGAAFVYEDNLARIPEIAALRSAVSRQDALSWLRERVMANRTPGTLNPRFVFAATADGLSVTSCLWRPQEDTFNGAYLFRDTAREGETLPVTICLWEEGTRKLQENSGVLREICAAGRGALVLDTSGVGMMTSRPVNSASVNARYGTNHKLATDLLFLGDDMLALRTFDVLRALDMSAAWPALEPDAAEIYAAGRHGVAGRLAAALDSRVKRLTVADGPRSWEEGVRTRHYEFSGVYDIILRGSLRWFDLTDL